MTMFWSSENGRRMSILQSTTTSLQRSVVTRILLGLRVATTTVAGSTVDIANDLLDIDWFRAGGTLPSMKTQSVWTATSTPTKASGLCRTAAVTIDSAIASASRSG